MSVINMEIRFNKIRSLMHMAKKDSLTELAEIPYIIWVAQKLGISADELKDIAEGEQGFSAPYTAQERTSFFYELMQSIYGDGPIKEDEIQNCSELAIKMELNLKSVMRLLKRLKENSYRMMDHTVYESCFA